MKKLILILIVQLSIVLSHAQKFTPPNGQRLSFIGQDIPSVNAYKGSGGFQTPAGVTTYINDANNGLRNTVGAANATNNAVQSANENPNSCISIGYYMVNQTNAIAAGQRDAQIRDLANYISEVNRPVFLRIGYEFDGAWNAYNQTSYINAFKRIVDIIRQNPNAAKWLVTVWQSCTSVFDDNIDGGRENIAAYYPGDNYVDWVGLSWFLLPNEVSTVGGTVSTQSFLTTELVNFGRSHGKPIMISESTPQGYQLDINNNCNISPGWDGAAGQGCVNKTAAQIWNEWYVPFFNFIYGNADVRAVAYINANWDAQPQWGPPYGSGYWGDTRVESNATIKNNWIAELNKPTWLHGSSTLFNTLSGGGGGGGTTTAPIGKAITLRGSNVRFVSSENGAQSGITCNRTAAGSWERFTVVSAGNGKIALKGTNGRYLSSENGTQALRCDRTTIGASEAFDWVAVNGTTVQLRGNNARFVSSENGVGSMTCNRTAAGAWENFNWAENGTPFANISTATEELLITNDADAGFTVVAISGTAKMFRVTLPADVNTLSIMDISGRQVNKIQVKGKRIVDVNLNNAAGIYIIQAVSATKSMSKKIVVE
jgi:FRG1-like domain/Glycosyl hydrolase family 26